MRNGIRALRVALAVASASTAAQAQAQAPAQAQLQTGATCAAAEKAASERQAADQARLNVALASLPPGDFKAVEAQSMTLNAILDRAPTHRSDVACDGSRVVYVNSTAEALAAMLVAVGHPGTGKVVARSTGPYPVAALLLGSLDVERGRSEHGLVYLRRGLALAPTEPGLTTEAANDLSHLGRPGEALEIVDRTLTGNPALPDLQRATLLRAKGYSLGELKRYDEAEAAYRQSLTLQPGHVGARNELIYLARMKAGGPATPSVLMTGGQSATTSADAVLAERRREGK